MDGFGSVEDLAKGLRDALFLSNVTNEYQQTFFTWLKEIHKK